MWHARSSSCRRASSRDRGGCTCTVGKAAGLAVGGEAVIKAAAMEAAAMEAAAMETAARLLAETAAMARVMAEAATEDAQAVRIPMVEAFRK